MYCTILYMQIYGITSTYGLIRFIMVRHGSVWSIVVRQGIRTRKPSWENMRQRCMKNERLTKHWNEYFAAPILLVLSFLCLRLSVLSRHFNHPFQNYPSSNKHFQPPPRSTDRQATIIPVTSHGHDIQEIVYGMVWVDAWIVKLTWSMNCPRIVRIHSV